MNLIKYHTHMEMNLPKKEVNTFLIEYKLAVWNVRYTHELFSDPC